MTDWTEYADRAAAEAREFDGDRAADWAIERGYYVSHVGGIAYVPLDDLGHLLADAGEIPALSIDVRGAGAKPAAER